MDSIFWGEKLQSHIAKGHAYGSEKHLWSFKKIYHKQGPHYVRKHSHYQRLMEAFQKDTGDNLKELPLPGGDGGSLL